MSPSVPLIVIDDSSDGSDGDDSVVEVVANPAAPPPPPPPAEATTTRSATDARPKDDNAHATDNGDDDIQDMGTTNALRLPHARHDCTHHAFVPDVLHSFQNTPGFRSALVATARRDLETNATTCDMCFCFVCDRVASECPSWSVDVGSGSRDQSSMSSSVEFARSMTAASCHCLASCKGADENLWVSMRKDMQKQKDQQKQKQKGNASAGTGSNKGNTGTSNQDDAARSGSNRSTRDESSSRRQQTIVQGKLLI